MTIRVDIAELSIEVLRKPIKHLHLGVYPPDGRVRIAAPERIGLDAIRLFAIGKLSWIRRQRLKLSAQPRQSPLDYIDRESHYLWGRRYLLRIIESDAKPRVELAHRQLLLHIRPNATPLNRRLVLERWYRDQIRQQLPQLLAVWQHALGVNIDTVYLQRMKTKWGACNPRTRNIRLNTELAKKPKECIEYVLVHELAHLLEPAHGDRFIALMDSALPNWRALRDGLNALPLPSAARP